MSARALLLLLLVVLLGLFTLLNWQAFTTPATLWLLFGHVQAPLGLIMLVITGILAALFLLYAFYLQATSLRESRRHARELQTQRQLAEESEASRLRELRTTLQTALQSLEQQIGQSQSQLQQRMDQLATEVSTYIGELEDRLERRGAAPAAETPH